MIQFAIIHAASGAIVMMTMSADVALPAHLERRPVPAGVDPGLHWWNGWSFAPREDAAIDAVVAGEQVTVACPDDAWLAFADGTIAMDRSIATPVRRARVMLVGRYRGDCWIEVQA